MNYQITPMTAVHLSQVAKLEKLCFPADPWSEKLFRAALDNPQTTILLAEGEDGEILGYAVLFTVLEQGSLDNIAVAPNARRHGVADALLGALTDLGRERLTTLMLEVRASNAPAIALYEKHGFVAIGRRKNYYADPKENAILMVLTFPKEIYQWKLEIRELSRAELAALYADELVHTFPSAELKPLAAMLRLMDMGRYEPLLVLDGERPVGYALAWLPEGREGALLDYFGVLRGLRNGGLGAKILELLGSRYGQIFGEAEAPGPDASPEENDLRRRRIAFYERSGFRVLDYQCALFGVRFHCLYRGPEADDRKVEALHRGVYAGYFSPAHMERYIQLPLAPGEAVKPAPEWVEEAFPVPES